MNLYNDTTSAHVDPGVLKRLTRLDRELRVTYSNWALNLESSFPIKSKHFSNLGKYIPEPSFHLWVWCAEYGRYLHVNQYPAEIGFSHREVHFLEADCARTMTPTQMLALAARNREANAAKAKADHAELREDVHKANKSRIEDMLDLEPGRKKTSVGDASGSRDAKIVSYPGQGNRGSRGRVRKEDREDGWEKPEQS